VPPELVEAFARAVAAPGSKALVYRPGGANEVEGWRSLDEALRLAATEGRAFAVRVRADLVVGDFDRPEQADAVVALTGELRAEGLKPVMQASGQPGRRHLWVAVPDAELRAKVAARFKVAGADLRVGTQPIRPLLSPHRLGLPVKLLFPTDPTTALAALAAPTATRQESRRRDLTDKARQLLAADPADRSPAIRSALLALANAGRTEAEAWEAITSNPVGRRYTSGDRSRTHFSQEWQRAVAFVSTNPPFASGDDAATAAGRAG
jgi:hypothetical protein